MSVSAIHTGFASAGLPAALRPDAGLRACWAVALLIGLAAGGTLYVSTVDAARAGALAPLMAAGQALGVFAGAIGAGGWPARRAAFVGAGLTLAGCLGLITLSGLAATGAGVVVGLGVGLAIAAADAQAACRAGASTRGSTVLGVALFAALGAALAPVLAEAARAGGIGPYAPFVVAAALALPASARLEGAARAPSRRAAAAAPFHLLFAAFVFGVVDNGVLALAPAGYAAAGAGAIATALVAVAAAGAAAIMQVFAADRVEAACERAPLRLMRGGLAAAIACLFAVAAGPGPGPGVLVFLLLGISIDVVYGAALVMRLSKAAPADLAGATAAFVGMCALGEVVGPLLVAGAGLIGLGGAAAWAPAAVLLAAALLVSVREPARG